MMIDVHPYVSLRPVRDAWGDISTTSEQALIGCEDLQETRVEGGPAWKGPGLPGEGVEVREVRWFARTRLVCDHGGVGAKPDGWTQGEPGVGKPSRESSAGQHQARRAARSQGAHGCAPDPHPTPWTPRALRRENMTSHRPQRSNVATEQVVKGVQNSETAGKRPQGQDAERHNHKRCSKEPPRK